MRRELHIGKVHGQRPLSPVTSLISGHCGGTRPVAVLQPPGVTHRDRRGQQPSFSTPQKSAIVPIVAADLATKSDWLFESWPARCGSFRTSPRAAPTVDGQVETPSAPTHAGGSRRFVAFCARPFFMITLPVCLWCRRPFSARRGGSPKRFCCAAHRTAFWSAARRWAEKAVVSGFLSVDDIRNGVGEVCTLLAGVNSPAPAGLSQKSGDIAPAERPGEAVELLDDA